MLLNKTTLNFVTKFAGENDTRYILNGVKLENDQLVATDGHMLAVVPCPKEIPAKDYPHCEGIKFDDTPLESCVVPTEFLDNLSKAIPKIKNTMPALSYAAVNVAGSNENGKLEVFTTDLEQTQRHSTRKMEGKFPDYDKVIPKEEPVYRITVNAAYLQQIAKAFDQIGGKNCNAVTLEFQPGEYGPIKITGNTANGQEVLVILMPLKGKKPGGLNQEKVLRDWASRGFGEDYGYSS